jgi:hypothetical protein
MFCERKDNGKIMTYFRNPYDGDLHRTNILIGRGQIAELRSFGLEASSVLRELLSAHISILRQTKGNGMKNTETLLPGVHGEPGCTPKKEDTGVSASVAHEERKFDEKEIDNGFTA